MRLRPAEYELLKMPYWGDADILLTKVLQELIILNVLKIEWRKVKTHPSDPHYRTRAFIGIGSDSKFKPEPCDLFFLDILQKNGTMGLGLLSSIIRRTLNKEIEKYKSEFIIPVAIKKELLINSFLRTGKGKRLKNELHSLLLNVELHAKKEVLDQKFLGDSLSELGTNFILLDPEVLKKLGKYLALPEISDVLSVQGFENQFSMLNAISIGSYASFDSISFDGFGGSDFGDFGGGDFGGGGGGDSW